MKNPALLRIETGLVTKRGRTIAQHGCQRNQLTKAFVQPRSVDLVEAKKIHTLAGIDEPNCPL